MPNSEARNLRARTVPTEPKPTRRIAVIAPRPLRLAFVINANTSKQQLLKYLKYNSNIWGGYYNLFIPTDGKTLRQDWCQVLRRNDPDLVIFGGRVSAKLVTEVLQRTSPFYAWKWSNRALAQRPPEADIFGSIPMLYPLLSLYEKSRPTSKSNVRVPKLEPRYEYPEYIAALFGVQPSDIAEFCVEGLQGEFVDVKNDSLEIYLARISELGNLLTPIRLTKVETSTFAEAPGIDFTIVIASGNPAPDFCLFWNMRMLSFLGRERVFILPSTLLRSEQDIQFLGKWCNESAGDTNHITLASATLGRRRLLDLRSRLLPHLNSRIEHVDIWFSNFLLGGLGVHGKQEKQEINFSDGDYRFKALPLPFVEQLHDGTWVVDMQLEGEGIAPTGFWPPKSVEIDRLLSGRPSVLSIDLSRGISTRIANGQLSRRTRRDKEYLSGKLPTEEEVFKALLEGKGYQAAATDKCRYVRGVTDLSGGLQNLGIWRDPKVRNMFLEMGKGGTFTVNRMMQILRPGDDDAKRDAYRQMIADLTLEGVFLRGYQIRCPACDLTRWYATDVIEEEMPCAGCLTLMQPPLEAPFHYKLNELVARAIEQGSGPVLLTLQLLQMLCRVSFLSLPGVAVRKGGETDLDIIASCDGHLVLAECKDLRRGASGRTVKEISSQLAEIVDIAKDLDADMVFLAVLSPTIPKTLRTRVDNLQKHTKSVAVHLLTAADLERGFKARPRPADPTKDDPLSLQDLLPSLKTHARGWVRTPGVRRTSV